MMRADVIAYLEQAATVPFAWGVSDCVQLAAGMVERVRGANPLGELTYSSEIEAKRVLVERGGLEAAVTAVLGPMQRDRRLCGDGDIVLTAFEYHRTFPRFLDRPLTPLYQELVEVPPRDRSLALVLHRLYMFHVSLTKPEATRWGDKTPWNTFAIGPIDDVFPDARFVHMVRDGRDVVASLLTMGRYSEASDAARRWVASIRAARRFGARHPDRYLEVRYEDLVTENAREVARACAFLDLPLDERMLRHHEVHSVVDDVEDIAHMAGARHAVHAKSIGKWRTTLTTDQARATERIVGPLLAELGYGDGAPA